MLGLYEMGRQNKKKRKRVERGSIHPRNKYCENPPDFGLLASLYPSFQPYVFFTRDGRPRIDWTDYNATRELTRVLLLHDHALNWWIPDGQLCPTVPNRSNYIHWIEDLLSSDIIPSARANGDVVKGFDIGTGANCIYPLLGASLLGWSFVGSDITDVALEWANKNVENNPHISSLIEIRKVDSEIKTVHLEELHSDQSVGGAADKDPMTSSLLKLYPGANPRYQGPPVLFGSVKDDEKFDFCMCNPPFFKTMEESGLNPNTSCGGTSAEMVCSGGEQAFISRIIEDSAQLKQCFRWYTSMVGKKSNLKTLISNLWEAGVTVVKTTEFVQGQTCRWGLAWSFVPPARKILSNAAGEKGALSFILEGVQRQYGAIHVLQSVESFFSSIGASCKSNVASFHVDITASQCHYDAILRDGSQREACNYVVDTSSGSNSPNAPSNDLKFRISVFQQIPGTLLVRGSLQRSENSVPGAFSLIFQQFEENVRNKFCGEKAPVAESFHSNSARLQH